MGADGMLNAAYAALSDGDLRWTDTHFQAAHGHGTAAYYYAEEGMYVFREWAERGVPKYVLVKARSPLEAFRLVYGFHVATFTDKEVYVKAPGLPHGKMEDEERA